MPKTRSSKTKKSPGTKNCTEVLSLAEVNFTLTSEDLRNQVCRVCAKYYSPGGANLIPLFELHGCSSGKSLSDVVNAFLPIKVVKDDGLPERACQPCTDQLLRWRDIWEACAEADKLLHSQAQFTTQHNFVPRYDQSPERSPETGPGSEAEEGTPLAGLAGGPLAALRRALRALRDHARRGHARAATEGSGEGAAGGGAEDADRFDDLTRYNMRRDRFDERTRAELDAARTRDGGRTYYACGACGRRLGSAHAYVHHARIHTGERPQVCHVCGKRFRAPQGLARHVAETHERRRRRPCRLCARTFANEQNLRQHLRTHTGERPYRCDECGKRFAQSGSLHAHRRTHLAGRAFACAECGAAFRLRAGLARHAARHSGERPHRCACGRAFAARHELVAHLPLHGDLAAHACDLCGAAYKLRRALRDHTRRVHPDLTRGSFTGTPAT